MDQKEALPHRGQFYIRPFCADKFPLHVQSRDQADPRFALCKWPVQSEQLLLFLDREITRTGAYQAVMTLNPTVAKLVIDDSTSLACSIGMVSVTSRLGSSLPVAINASKPG